MPMLPKQPKLQHPASVRAAWKDEMARATTAREAGDDASEWDHLERAHILSQPFTGAHTRTHLAMLRFAVRHRDRREILGQIARTIVAGPGSAMRRYPLGNTGGADVSAVQPMPIPDDLQAILAG
jgi:hypothetical protein